MIEPRPQVLEAPVPVHGGPSGRLDESFPVRLDFSTSVNAWGPADAVRDAVRSAPPDVYPDPESLAVRRAMAEVCGRPLNEIAFAAGAAELIHAVCFTFLRPGDSALVPSPTFGEYARSAALCGARVLHRMADPPLFRMDAAEIAAAVAEHHPRLVFLCAPNNPTGQPFTRAELIRVADACAGAGVLLVLDQAYDAFTRAPLGTPALPGHPAVLHLRSITKDHALAGVRAGFAVGPPEVIGLLERARVPWSASTTAQAAAIASLSRAAEEHLRTTLPRLRFGREQLETAFKRLRIATLPTGTHYFLAEVGDAAEAHRRLLAEHGVKVRDCTSFGLPRHIRMAARTPAENRELVRALEAVFST